ncbi:MAG: hypothetical protein R3A12_11610 [Ignavibacteria bacterium]
MKDYSLFRVDSGSGNFPTPHLRLPPPPRISVPPPPPPPSSGQPQNSGNASSNTIIALVLGILLYLLAEFCIHSGLDSW